MIIRRCLGELLSSGMGNRTDQGGALRIKNQERQYGKVVWKKRLTLCSLSMGITGSWQHVKLSPGKMFHLRSQSCYPMPPDLISQARLTSIFATICSVTNNHNLGLYVQNSSSHALSYAIAAIDDDVCPGGIGARIADEVHICSLQLLRLAITAQGDHRFPEVLNILRNEIRKTGVDVARGDAVDASKVSPFIGKRPGQVETASLGHVVRGLLLRIIGNVAGHGGGDDKAAGPALLEMVTNSLGAVEGTCQIGLDDLVPVLDGAVQDAAVGSAAGVGDKCIDLAEVFDDVADELGNVVVVAHVAFVCLGLDAVFLAQLFCVLLPSFWASGIGDGDIGSHLRSAAGSLNAHALGTRGTSDNDDLALQAEEVGEAVGLGDSNRHV